MSRQKQRSDKAASGQSAQAKEGVHTAQDMQQTMADMMEQCACSEIMSMVMDKCRASLAKQ